MRLTNTPTSYGLIARGFHWLMALLILTMIPLGFVANDAPFDTDAAFARKFMLFSLHKTLGVCIFGLAILRVLWALQQPKPAPLHPDRQIETLLARLTHVMLYSAMIMVPLTGWIEHAAIPGLAPIWWPFGQSLPFVSASEWIFTTASALHRTFVKVLIVALGLHILGAIKHQLFDADATLPRMWSGKPGGGATGQRTSLVPIGIACVIWSCAVAVGISLG